MLTFTKGWSVTAPHPKGQFWRQFDNVLKGQCHEILYPLFSLTILHIPSVLVIHIMSIFACGLEFAEIFSCAKSSAVSLTPRVKNYSWKFQRVFYALKRQFHQILDTFKTHLDPWFTAKIKFMKRVKVLNTYIFRRGVYLKTNNADFGVSLPPKSYFYDTTESEVFFIMTPGPLVPFKGGTSSYLY